MRAAGPDFRVRRLDLIEHSVLEVKSTGDPDVGRLNAVWPTGHLGRVEIERFRLAAARPGDLNFRQSESLDSQGTAGAVASKRDATFAEHDALR